MEPYANESSQSLNVSTPEEPAKTREVFPAWRIMLFSLGGMGNVIMSSIAGLMTYFYVSPETAQANFPQYLPIGTFMGFTVFGVINFLGVVLSALLGPFVASWSDRSKSRFGRRRAFIMGSFLPIAILSFMVFTPPVNGVSGLNVAYLFAVVILLNVFRTFNGVSNAIAPEFGTSGKSMMYFSTFGSVGWILGYLIGSQVVYVIKDAFAASGMTVLDAFRLTAGILIAAGCVMSVFQFLVIDEKRYGSGKTSPVRLLSAFKTVLKSKHFIKFILANQVYIWGDTIFNTGLVFFVTVNYGLDESMMLEFGAVLIALSLAQYPLVNILARKIGKKRLFLFSLAVMASVLVVFAFPQIVPIPKMALVWVIVFLASVYSSITGIIPGAIANEIIREDCARTGLSGEASYNAVGGLLLAIPAALPGLVIPSLLMLGKSPEHNTGVVAVALTCAGCLLAAFILIYLLYNEKKVLASLKEHGYQ